MSSTNNSNTPAKTSNHDDPISSISPVLGTSKPSPLSTPYVANRRSLEAVNENKTERKKRSFDEIDAIVEEQEGHGAMTLQSNVKRAKKGPSVTDMLALIEVIEEHEPHVSAREMDMDDLQQAYDRIVNEQQRKEAHKNDTVEIPTSSAASSHPHLHLFYENEVQKRKGLFEQHQSCVKNVDSLQNNISSFNNILMYNETVKTKSVSELADAYDAKKKQIRKMRNDLVERTKKKREDLAQELQKYRKPLLDKIDEQEVEFADTTRNLVQKVEDARSRSDELLADTTRNLVQKVEDARSRSDELKNDIPLSENALVRMDKDREDASKDWIESKTKVKQYETIIKCLKGELNIAPNEVFAEASCETLRELFHVENMRTALLAPSYNVLKTFFAKPLSIGGHPKKEEISKLMKVSRQGQALEMKLLLVKIFFGEEATPTVDLDYRGLINEM